MKNFKNTCTIFLLLLFLFSGCTSAQKLQEKAPFNYNEVYFQKWVAGIKEGGSGMNLFIPISSELTKNVQMDSVYFRGKAALLEHIEGERTMYVGRFIDKFNQKRDPIISIQDNNSETEQTTILQEKIPFKLKDTECVVSYKQGNETKYFKIEDIVEKQIQNYPSAPNRHE